MISLREERRYPFWQKSKVVFLQKAKNKAVFCQNFKVWSADGLFRAFKRLESIGYVDKYFKYI